MRILVVDDSDAKRKSVTDILTLRLAQHHPEIFPVESYEEALTALQSDFYDLVILDLLLPAANGEPSIDPSRALIRSILRGKLIPPTYIIGLTEFRDVGKEEEKFYEENLFALEFYDPLSTTWADKIANRVNYLMMSKNAAIKFQMENYGIDIVILTARYENEFIPVKKTIFHEIESTEHPLWKGSFAQGTIKLSGKKLLRAVLCCVGEMGMAPTAAVASQAISIFRPKLISMLGMCCGFSVIECSSPKKILDAIVVRQVACWEEGRFVEHDASAGDFRNRAKVRLVDDRIRDSVEQIIERSAETLLPQQKKFAGTASFKKVANAFESGIVRDVPEVKFGSMVSGSSVIADEAVVKEIIQRHPSATGLDMEMYGLYSAVDRSFGKKPSVLGIKAVADFGEASKNDIAQYGASQFSAIIFKEILRHLDIM